MRWLHKPADKDGDVRQVHVFLWWPRRIGDESRWLEKTWIRQKYAMYRGWSGWEDVCFLIG